MKDFAALRERDRAAAPSFDEMMARPPPRRASPLLYVLPAAAALAMAAAFVLWIAAGTHDAEPPRDRLITVVANDPEPLGFLLDEPATLARVPDFDSSPIKERRR
jgi:hypothetical protein